MPKLLIVDDNRKVAKSLESILGIAGYECRYAATSSEALLLVKEDWPDVVLLDIMLGSENGIDCLRKIKEEHINLPVIMITGYATIENAVLSMKLGAFDFIQKPLNFDHLKQIINNAVRLKQLQNENKSLHARLSEIGPKLLFRSVVMKELFIQAQRIASTDLPVFIKGETGTGKELLADFIHSESLRRGRQLNKINCAAFPESLLDNELFGHERGAFTGATGIFRGIFERSDGGTLFLDEIGDMPMTIQAKILRVLQNSEIRRLGGSETIKLNVRFIAATNKNPEILIREGLFREDLFFRLNAITLCMPPLRDRLEDIPLLAEHFLNEFSATTNWRQREFAPETMQALMSYYWPGNVRELKNVVMYACAIGQGHEIKLSDLPPAINNNHNSTLLRGAKEISILDQLIIPRSQEYTSKYGSDPRSVAEAEIIKSVLVQCGFNKKKSAEILKMSRNTLYRKISQYGILDGEQSQ
jgi:DNA-binding NtrC family response regulator